MSLEDAFEDAQVLLCREGTRANVAGVGRGEHDLDRELSNSLELGPHFQLTNIIAVLACVVRLFQIVATKMIAHHLSRSEPFESTPLDPASDVLILPERNVGHPNVFDSFRPD